MIDHVILMFTGGLLLLIAPGVMIRFLNKNGISKVSMWKLISFAGVTCLFGLYIVIASLGMSV